MKLFTRTLVATTIAMGLAACGGGDKKEVLTEGPITLMGNNVIVKGMAESVSIDTVEGNKENVLIEAFKGIPYAEAVRFGHSHIIDFEGNVDASKFRAACLQERDTSVEQDEDCLNLNIWRPANIDADAKLPVYVFIHGGSFEAGSGSHKMNQADVIVAQSISDTQLGKRTEPFIAVSLNYRLGMLGSLYTTDPAGGNYGWVIKSVHYSG